MLEEVQQIGEPPASTVAVVGAASGIGLQLLPLLAGRGRGFVRRASGIPGEIVIRDYRALRVADFSGIDCVVNCAGIRDGDADLFRTVNVELPDHLARIARDAGARRFIHISSFSVYGPATRVDAGTPAQPTSAYGRSKLEADERLLALAGPGFEIVPLRLPLIYRRAGASKLHQLIGLWRRLGTLPIPAGDLQRAMISDRLCAETIAALVDQTGSGIVHAADPEPFRYARAQAALRAGSRARFGLLPLPAAAFAPVRLAAPELARSMFSDSILPPAENAAVRFGLQSRLYNDIAELAA